MIDYDKYIVAFSGGKDSTSLVLYLLENGIPKNKIELWHHDVDGRGKNFMDWEITPAYCIAFARAIGIPLYFSWKEGGFKREMMRNEQPTAPILFQDHNYRIIKVGGKGPNGTRLKFPQVSADLSVRWCSSYLKIDVCAAAIRNQKRFRGKKIVVLSGERGEESPARAKYKVLEPDRADLRNGKKYQRHVDRWRPLRDWKEFKVWEIIEKYNIRVHPCYYLGWNRCSCKFCIFGNDNQYCSACKVSPAKFMQLANMERKLGFTIKRDKSLYELIETGKPYDGLKNQELKSLIISRSYDQDIIMTDPWVLPSGAYGENIGPT